MRPEYQARKTVTNTLEAPMLKLLLIVCLGIVAGCTKNPVNTENNFNQGAAQREIISINDKRVTSQAAAINSFAVKMYSQLIVSDENVFFSPYSITVALGMADAGAWGETDRQIRSALCVNANGDNFHAGLDGIDLSLRTYADTAGDLQLSVANNIWVQNDFTIKDRFLDILTQYYGSGINLLNFKLYPDSSREIINDSVSDQTRGRINNLLPFGSIKDSTKLVLTNAVYFLAEWLLKFDISRTYNKDFIKLNGNKVSVPTMQMSYMDFKFKQSGNYKVLELPYKGQRIVMDIILPDSGQFSQFESGLSSLNITDLFNGLSSTELSLISIPRFEFTTLSISLSRAFQKLGMILPFSPNADFSSISDSSLCITDIFHKAFVKVNETGTEAAAATAVIIGRATSALVQPGLVRPEFIADHPFIYLIRDTQTNAILFIGREVDPEVSE
jgi:serpin B